MLPDAEEVARWKTVFGDGATREYARWLIWELAQAVGVRPASIHELYMARGKGLGYNVEVHGQTI